MSRRQEGCLVTGCSPVLLILFVIVALLLSGCSYPGTPIGEDGSNAVRYFHDDERKVSCWLVWSSAISCLPDSEVAR